MKKKAVIIPAAGSGSRLGSDIPKPFIELCGITILQRSIECFQHLEGGVEIVVATSKANFDKCTQIFEQISAENLSLKVVEGGNERQHSIWNAIQALSESVELVAIHDAVRPFVSIKHIRQCFEGAQKVGGAILAIPAKDTIKRVDQNHFIVDTPDRSQLWQAQTPQVFKKHIILEAYKLALHEKFLGTDDASLVERMGNRISIVEGDRTNLKITYPIDLKVAELILKENL